MSRRGLQRLRRLAIATAVALLSAACKVGPNFAPPHEPAPDHYASVGKVADTEAGTAASTAGPGSSPRADDAAEPDSFWWQQFHDPELDRLEQEAVAGNLDLKTAYLRIVESRMQVLSARAQGLPSLNASASFEREQLGLAGILKSQGISTGPSTSASTQQLLNGLQAPVNIYQLGFDASWELDLFGKVRRNVEGAEAQSAGQIESRNDLLVSLAAEVAQTYFQLRAGQVQRQIALDLIAEQRDDLALIESRFQHGLTGEADVASARGQLASLESQLPPHEQTIASAKHALAVLTGRQPEALDAEFGDAGALPSPPASVPVGLPSTLVRRRPDIRQAEDTLHAATAQIGVAVAAFFPDVSLSGSYGLRNTGTRYLFDWSSNFYTYGPKISIPIFQGGSLVANVRLSRAQAAEAAFNYRKTVLSALQDVEDGLTGLQTDAARCASLRETVGADQRAVDIDLNAYNHGILSYLNVLTAQIQVQQAREQLAEALLTQSTDLVKLYKALGGGWENAPKIATDAESP
jgi:NodT family efflux transporter outer membrane factor (OMF) lipoprotein